MVIQCAARPVNVLSCQTPQAWVNTEPEVVGFGHFTHFMHIFQESHVPSQQT